MSRKHAAVIDQMNRALAESVARAMDNMNAARRGYSSPLHLARRRYATGGIKPPTYHYSACPGVSIRNLTAHPIERPAMTDTPAPYTPDTLAAWWDAAETGPVREGDTFIREDTGQSSYVVGTALSDFPERTYRRVIKRARQPWQDAPAVMAHTADDDTRRAFLYNAREDEWWDNSEWGTYSADDLIHPRPMTEAHVTDEVAERAEKVYRVNAGVHPSGTVARAMAAAALGTDRFTI